MAYSSRSDSNQQHSLLPYNLPRACLCLIPFRLWGTYPLLHKLRKELDIKQLRAALERTPGGEVDLWRRMKTSSDLLDVDLGIDQNCSLYKNSVIWCLWD